MDFRPTRARAQVRRFPWRKRSRSRRRRRRLGRYKRNTIKITI